jgi:hypothetical protein
LRGKNGNNELAIAFVHGRIDREIEVWAERFSIPAMELKQELGTIFVSQESNRLPSAGMHQTASGSNGQSMATLEMAIGTYGRGAQRSGHEGTTDSEVPSLASGEVKDKRRGPANWYAKLSDKEKMRVSLERLKKRKDDRGKKMYKALLAKSKGKVSITEHKRDISKQHIYAARNRARQKGLPLPPLPSENAA